jgi:hypothetical protein
VGSCKYGDEPVVSGTTESVSDNLFVKYLFVTGETAGYNSATVVVEWLTFLLHIREVPGSNLSLETSYPEVFHDFPQSLQANAFQIHRSLTTLSSDYVT